MELLCEEGGGTLTGKREWSVNKKNMEVWIHGGQCRIQSERGFVDDSPQAD